MRKRRLRLFLSRLFCFEWRSGGGGPLATFRINSRDGGNDGRGALVQKLRIQSTLRTKVLKSQYSIKKEDLTLVLCRIPSRKLKLFDKDNKLIYFYI